MLEIRKSKKARIDLKGIWDYTSDKWSAKQADKYLRALNQAMTLLAEHPKIGKARENIQPDLRSFHVERHMIYYRMEPDHLLILRVRYDGSDPDLYED